MRLILTSKQSLSDDYHIKQIFPVAFKCKSIHLSSVSIPYSFYNLRSSNNEVIVDGLTRTIPEKNYNSIQLATTLSGFLPSGCICSFDRQTLKYTLTNDSISTVRIQFTSSHAIFGFIANQEYFISSGDTLTSPLVADINDGLQAIILTSNIANSFSSLFNDNFGTNIIARIPIAHHKNGETIQYNNRFNSQPIVKDFSLQFIEIEVRDDNLELLHLNGVQMQIEFFIELDDEQKLISDLRN